MRRGSRCDCHNQYQTHTSSSIHTHTPSLNLTFISSSFLSSLTFSQPPSPLSSFPLVSSLPPSSMRPVHPLLPFFYPLLIPPSSLLPPLPPCSFTLSTLVAPIMQMSVCGGALKSRLGPGSLLIVTWLFHRGQQEAGISTRV